VISSQASCFSKALIDVFCSFVKNPCLSILASCFDALLLEAFVNLHSIEGSGVVVVRKCNNASYL